MKRFCFFFSLGFITLSSAVFAQNDTKALEALDNASAAYLKAGGIKAAFSLKVLDYGGTVKENINGSIRLKGCRFKMEVPGMTTWFDGKNQWVYFTQNNEVNLSNPSEEELLMVNPVNVFQLYKHGYTCKWEGEKTENKKTLQKIRLYPQDKNGLLESILVAFDKVTRRPVSIAITNKDKSGSSIVISSYQTGQIYADVFFVFQQKDFPNTEVVDLR